MTSEDDWFALLPQGSGLQVDLYPVGAKMLRTEDSWLDIYRKAQEGLLEVAPIAVDVRPSKPPRPLRACLGKCSMGYLKGQNAKFVWHPTKRRYVDDPSPVPKWLIEPGFENIQVAKARIDRWIRTRFLQVVQEVHGLRHVILWAKYFNKPHGVIVIPETADLPDVLMALLNNLKDRCSGPFHYPHRKKLSYGGPFDKLILEAREFAVYDSTVAGFQKEASRIWATHRNRWLLLVVPAGRLLRDATATTHAHHLMYGMDYMIQVGTPETPEAARLVGKLASAAPILFRVGWSPADALAYRWQRQGADPIKTPEVIQRIQTWALQEPPHVY